MKILGISLTTLVLIFVAFYMGTRWPDAFARLKPAA